MKKNRNFWLLTVCLFAQHNFLMAIGGRALEQNVRHESVEHSELSTGKSSGESLAVISLEAQNNPDAIAKTSPARPDKKPTLSFTDEGHPVVTSIGGGFDFNQSFAEVKSDAVASDAHTDTNSLTLTDSSSKEQSAPLSASAAQPVAKQLVETAPVTVVARSKNAQGESYVEYSNGTRKTFHNDGSVRIELKNDAGDFCDIALNGDIKISKNGQTITAKASGYESKAKLLNSPAQIEALINNIIADLGTVDPAQQKSIVENAIKNWSPSSFMPWFNSLIEQIVTWLSKLNTKDEAATPPGKLTLKDSDISNYGDSDNVVAARDGKKALADYKRITNFANRGMNPAEKNTIAFGTSTVSADGKITAFTYKDVTVNVDSTTGKVIDSTAKGSLFTAPLTDANMQKVSGDTARPDAYKQVSTENTAMNLQEKNAVAFGQKRTDGNYTVYVYKNSKVTVDSNNKIIDSNVKDSQYVSKETDASRLASGKFTAMTKSKIAPEAKTNEIHTDDVDKATIDLAQQLMAKIVFSDKVKPTITKTTKMFSSDPKDINFEKDRAAKFGQTRTGAQKMIRRLDLLATDKGKDQFVEEAIAGQFKESMGFDANSFESLFELQDKAALIAKIKADPTCKRLLENDPTLTATDKLNAIAKMGDHVMNHVAGDLATFESGFDDKGNYSSKISSKSGDGTQLAASSKVDNSGNEVQRSLSVGDTTFVIDLKDSSKNQILGKDGKPIAGADGKPKVLNSYENSLSTNSWLFFKADRAFKLTAKVALTCVKQGVINVPGKYVPMMVCGKATAIYVVLAPIIAVMPEIGWNKEGNLVIAKKGEQVETLTGMHLSGHDVSEVPSVVLTMTMKLVKFVVGDNGESLSGSFSGGQALLSKDSGSLFRKGTWASDLVNSLQGKTEKEVADINEGYVDFIEPLIKSISFLLKSAFPMTLGDQILSEAELKNNTVKTDISTKTTWQAPNERGEILSKIEKSDKSGTAVSTENITTSKGGIILHREKIDAKTQVSTVVDNDASGSLTSASVLNKEGSGYKFDVANNQLTLRQFSKNQKAGTQSRVVDLNEPKNSLQKAQTPEEVAKVFDTIFQEVFNNDPHLNDPACKAVKDQIVRDFMAKKKNSTDTNGTAGSALFKAGEIVLEVIVGILRFTGSMLQMAAIVALAAG